MVMPWEREYDDEEEGPWSRDYGLTPAELAQELKRRPAKPERELTPVDVALAESSAGERALIGLGSRFDDMGQGLKQTAGMAVDGGAAVAEWLLDKKLGRTGWADDVQRRRQEHEPYKQAIRRDTAATAGGIGADVLASTPMGMVARGPIMGSALIGGSLMGPMTPRSDNTWDELGRETLAGTVMGGAGGAATQGAMGALARAKNASIGRYKTPEITARAQAFRDWGVEPSIGDLTQSPVLMNAENLAGYFPFTGRSAFVANQNTALNRAGDRVTEQVLGQPSSGLKKDLSTKLVQSIKDKHASNKAAASRLYDAVERASIDPSIPPVQPSTLAQSARQLKKDYPDVFDAFQDSTAVKRLDSIIEGTGPQQSSILGPSGQPILKSPELSFSDARWLDKRLGAMIRQGEKRVQAGNMDPEAFNQITALQRALRTDIDDWSMNIGRPDIAQSVKDANKFWRENVLPFREDKALHSVLRDTIKTDDVPQRLFGGDKPIYSGEVMKFLTPEGQFAAKDFVLKKGKEEAKRIAENPTRTFLRPQGVTAAGEAGGEMLSPAELAKFSQFEDLLHAGRRAIGPDQSEQARWLTMLGMRSPSIPLVARGLTKLGTGKSARFMTADPRMYTGESPLGRVAEQLINSSGIGLGLDQYRSLSEE